MQEHNKHELRNDWLTDIQNSQLAGCPTPPYTSRVFSDSSAQSPTHAFGRLGNLRRPKTVLPAVLTGAFRSLPAAVLDGYL